MKIKEGQEKIYKDWKDKNNDGYSRQVFDYAEAWAERMEKYANEGKKIKKICEDTSHEVNDERGTWGLSGFQFGCAIQVLIQCWEYGEELKPYYKKWR